MEIPLLDLQSQYQSMKREIDAAIKEVVDSQYFVLSKEVSSLEEEVASYTGVKYGAGVNSGTDALIIALRAAGIGMGDEVITSPFTFFATSEAVSLLGAKPVFVDIDPETYNIDPEKIEEYLESKVKSHPELFASRNFGAGMSKVKAIIPVHIYGQCADMDRIMELAKKYDLKVIEDCAQSIGATYKGKKAGSFGDAGCFSFFPSKNLGGFGDGGMVVSNDKEIIEHSRSLRVHGSTKQYIHDEVAYNSRLDSLQAAILRVKLRKLDGWLEGRRNIAEKYNKAFSGVDIKVPSVGEGNVHTYHQYTIAVEDRDNLLKHLNDSGIAARVYYPVPLHVQPCYKELGYAKGSLPVAEEMSEKVISLPVYPELIEEKINYITKTVKDFLK